MTIPQMIRDRHARWKSRRCMQVKAQGGYQDVSWSEFYTAAEQVARALAARGVQTGDRVAILSHTRREWAVSDTGILSCGAVSVPIYPSLTTPEVKDLLVRSGARGVFLSDAEQLGKCRPLLEEVETLEFLVVFDPDALGESEDEAVSDLASFRASADRAPEDLVPQRLQEIGKDDLATIIFTSGTTGEPKGVMLSHRNILSNIEASLQLFDINTDDVCLSHLPLAHIFERMAGYYLMLSIGATIAYAEEIKTVADDMQAVRPTVAISVPRIFEKIYGGIQHKAAEAPAPVRALTFWALRVARRVGDLQSDGQPLPLALKLQYAVADHLVYGKIRDKMGGRLRFFISGGAPLAPELAKFFTAIGIQVYEGYGLTETSPVLAANYPGHRRVGTVGLPLSNVDLRIAEDGEILAKGPSVFSGYFGNEEATTEAFTEDGYFKTGDIGKIDADGFVHITDRKKDLIVTAGGKNVAPQKVENALKLSKYIAEVMLYGDRKKFISALIVPDFDWLERYAGLKNLSYSSRAELVENPAVQDYYERLVEETQQRAQVPGHEQVKRFVLLDQEFSAEGGEITPTLKLRRRQVTEHYRDQLEALYEEREEAR